MELRIDPEFQNKIPPLTAEEYEQLKENILEAGEVYEPIITWQGVIVDGHNRYKIIQENPGLIWKTKELDFPDKWAAFDWMYKNQLGRRNLTEQQRTMLIGQLAIARMHTHGGDRGNQYTNLASGQNGALPNDGKRTRDEIAGELGIGARTVDRAVAYAKGIEAIKEIAPGTAESILKGEIKPPKQEVSMIANADPQERQRMIEQIERGEKVTPVEVPDKIVLTPKSKYEGGGTAEYRAKRNEIAEVAAEMYDPSTVPEYDLETLMKEISWNAEAYVKTLRNTIRDHRQLATENKGTIEGIMDEIKNDIEKIKEEMDND